MEELKKEIEKADKLLSIEKNLDKVTFYEGYLKGLKFLKKLLVK